MLADWPQKLAEAKKALYEAGSELIDLPSTRRAEHYRGCFAKLGEIDMRAAFQDAGQDLVRADRAVPETREVMAIVIKEVFAELLEKDGSQALAIMAEAASPKTHYGNPRLFALLVEDFNRSYLRLPPAAPATACGPSSRRSHTTRDGISYAKWMQAYGPAAGA